jgi:hypothetical protein
VTFACYQGPHSLNYVTSRTAQNYFSNFFHRLIWAATFFGKGAALEDNKSRIRRRVDLLR